jgi:hypothetical protein
VGEGCIRETVSHWTGDKPCVTGRHTMIHILRGQRSSYQSYKCGLDQSRGPAITPASSLHRLVGACFLDGGDVLRLHALLTLGRLVGYLGTLLERSKPATCYRAVVHEEIIAPVVGLYEAVTLIAVEPLDRSLGHVPKPAFLSLGYPPPSFAAAIYQTRR